MSGVEFGVGEFREGFEGLFGDRISGGTDRKGGEDFAEVKIIGFEVRNAILDFENWRKDSGSDEVN